MKFLSHPRPLLLTLLLMVAAVFTASAADKVDINTASAAQLEAVAINRVRARGEHVFAGLEQLGGKWVRAMTLARNELAILLKCAAYNVKRLVWLTRHDPCGWAR